jgi:hypothetical protein
MLAQADEAEAAAAGPAGGAAMAARPGSLQGSGRWSGCSVARARSCAWHYRSVLLFALACTLMTGALAIANEATRGSNPWGGSLNPRDYYGCGPIAPGNLLRQPANALSNLGFVYVGLFFLLTAWREVRHCSWSACDEHFTLGNFPSLIAMVGLALVFEGYGSFHMHACGGQCAVGGFMDLAGIFALIYALLLVACAGALVFGKVLSPRRGHKPWVLELICWLAMVFGAYLAARWDVIFEQSIGYGNMKRLMVGIFGLLFVLCGTCATLARCNGIRPNHDYVLIPLSMLSVLIAVLCWFPDNLLGYCPFGGQDPMGHDIGRQAAQPLELHAAWHIFLSFAIGLGGLWLRALGRKEVEQHGLLPFLLLKDTAVLARDDTHKAALEREQPAHERDQPALSLV